MDNLRSGANHDRPFTGRDLEDPLFVRLGEARHFSCLGSLHSRSCVFVSEAEDLVSASPMSFDVLFDLANIRMVARDDEPLDEAEAMAALWSSNLFNIDPRQGFVFLNP